MTKQIRNGATEQEQAEAWAYVLCTDSFLSGWGQAKGVRSLYALVARSPEEAEILIANAKTRTDMKRPRIVSDPTKCMRSGDHLTIVGPTEAARWYEPGGFIKD